MCWECRNVWCWCYTVWQHRSTDTWLLVWGRIHWTRYKLFNTKLYYILKVFNNTVSGKYGSFIISFTLIKSWKTVRWCVVVLMGGGCNIKVVAKMSNYVFSSDCMYSGTKQTLYTHARNYLIILRCFVLMYH